MRSVIALLLGLAAVASCTRSRAVIVHTRGPAAPAAVSATDAMRPRGPDSGKARALVQQSVFGPLRSLFNTPGVARRLAGMRGEAYNVTSTDDVAESGWFVPRRRGAPLGLSVDRPDMSAAWVVVSRRTDAGGPVITIRDGRGREYWLTFDTPAHPELATATAAITAQLYRQTGYHAPDVTVVTLDPARLVAAIEDSATLARLPRGPDGQIRAAAHRAPGRVLGSFAFSGRRRDDPADSVPHEHRRELRGLFVVAAWLNHTDLFAGRTLDVVVDTGDGAYVRHYVLGFESGLAGRGITGSARVGTEAAWDPGRVAARLLSLGFYAAPWERNAGLPFDPGRWTPVVHNAAFDRLTVRDGFWGAKLLAGLSESDIETAVRAGRLSDAVTADSLVAALASRRRVTINHWFSKVTPLEELTLEQSPSGTRLTFTDLAVVEGLARAHDRRFEVRAMPSRGRVLRRSLTVDLAEDGRGLLILPTSGLFDARDPNVPLEEQLAWIEVQAVPEHGRAPRPLRIYVLPATGAGSAHRIVGLRY